MINHPDGPGTPARSGGDRIGMIGALYAHSLSMEAGGGWGRQGGSKESGLHREGVLYPYPRPQERVVKLETIPRQRGREAITTKLIETKSLGNSVHL